VRDGSSLSQEVRVPSACYVLDVKDWMEHLDPTSSVSAVVIRDEYRDALEAVVAHYMVGKVDFQTADDNDNEMADPTPIENPFLDLSVDMISCRAGFILLGHPGIGKSLRFLHA
jgi:hypothetical protein